MKLIHYSFLLAVILLTACHEPSVRFNYEPLTTPDLERTFELRKTGAIQAEWETVLAEQIEIVKSSDQMIRVLADWDLSTDELNHWKRQYGLAKQVIFYGTDLDGRMMIFYNERGQSIATWASWDRPMEE